MKDINTITVSGAVASQPEIKHVGQNGTAMLTFRVYCEREYSYQGITKVDKNYFDVKVWGDHAMDTSRTLREGARVTLQGRLTQESWESAGQRKYKVLVVADTVVNNDYREAPAHTTAPPIQAATPVPAYDSETGRPAGFPMSSFPKPPPPAFDSSPLDVKSTVLDAEDIDDIPF